MNRKKLWSIITIFVAYCILLIIISANNKSNNTTTVAQESTERARALSLEDDLISTIWEGYRVTISNASHTNDNPWGTTGGIINDVEFGNSIFLTPGTIAALQINKTENNCQLKMRVHPWVAQASDGMDVHVSYLDNQNEVLAEKRLIINSTEEYDFVADFHKYEQCSSLLFECGVGPNNNGSADWLIINRAYDHTSTFTAFGYVRSATYYGDEWPINFWNSEMDHLDDDLQQIKNDGFDSIIICIPWREFQPCLDPITYSSYTFEQLDRVMLAAKSKGLGVYTRISYTHDFFNDSNEFINNRMVALINNESVRDAWMEYADKLYSQLSQYESFKGGFITWEDFWGILSICDVESEVDRIQFAYSTDYQGWVRDNIQLSEYNKKYEVSYDSYASIPIPRRNEPAMEAMYEFYDDFLNGLLHQAQDKAFPNLSNEVRLDADPIFDSAGELKSTYKHTVTYACEDSDFTATMYGIPMGFENKGERVTAADAITKTEYILNSLKTLNQGKPIYVEQFLFFDNTPRFSHNARLQDEEVDDYLRLAADVLRNYTGGYGIWTYRDYYNNMIFNSGFYLKDNGWNCIGDVTFEQVNESSTAHLCAGQGISQNIGPIRNHFDSDEYTFSFDVVQCVNNGKLEVHVGDFETSFDITGTGKYEISFPKTTSFDINIICEEGSYNIDNLRMYSFIQNGYLYSPENEELVYLSSVRKLNEKLSQQ